MPPDPAEPPGSDFSSGTTPAAKNWLDTRRADADALDILYLDPFHGGSHAAVATGLVRHSRHRIRLLSLPARAWKWRMRGAALWFAEALRELPGAQRRADLVLTTDMLSAADLRALLPPELARLRLVVYFHENQLTYPDRADDPRDEHFAFTNLTSALVADQVWFNSDFHRQAFLTATRDLIARMPDHQPRAATTALAARSRTLHPGIEVAECSDVDPAADRAAADAAGDTRTPGGVSPTSPTPPLILWNHRWEHDKDPAAFFAALERVQQQGGRFRLAVAGQSFRRHPGVFDAVGERFAAELVSYGELPPAAYRRLLAETDIVVSTARHEFFGLAVLEAAAAGAYPLLPARLSYPEIIPAAHHRAHLYDSDDELVSRLIEILALPAPPRSPALRQHLRQTFAWPRRAAAFDAALAECVGAGG